MTTDRKAATLALDCGHSQHRAGFKAPDNRIFECPSCKADGFNTGWGYCAYTCGAEVLNGEDGEWSTPCPVAKSSQDREDANG